MLSVLLSLTVTGIGRGVATTPATKIGVPAYFVDPTMWNNMLAMPNLGHIIVNNSNPAQKAFLTAKVNAAHGIGAKVYGYVDTGYAPLAPSARPLADIQTSINAVFTAHPTMDGVFLDEVPTCDANAVNVDFFVGLRGWIAANHPGKTVVLNPGTALCQRFEAAGDIFMFFESSQDAFTTGFLDFYNAPDFDWIRALPDSRVWFVSYGVPQGDVCAAMQSLAFNGAGIVWTDDVASTATYNELPNASYLATAGACAGNGATPVVTTTTVAPTTTPTTTATIAPATTTTTITLAATTTAAAGTPTTAAPVTTTTMVTTTTVAPTTLAPTTTAKPVVPFVPSGSASKASAEAAAKAPTPVDTTASNSVGTPTGSGQGASNVGQPIVIPDATTTSESKSTTTVVSQTTTTQVATATPPTSVSSGQAPAATAVAKQPVAPKTILGFDDISTIPVALPFAWTVVGDPGYVV